MPTVFPALDEEPPAPSVRSRFRHVALTVAALVVLAGAAVGAWAAYGAVSGGSGAASGKVLAFNTLQQLVLANPDGSKPVAFSKLGIIGGHNAYVAPDGRVMVTDAGDVVTLEDGRPVSHSTALYEPLAGGGFTCSGVGPCYATNGEIDSSYPFADGAADVLFTLGYDPRKLQNLIKLVPTSGGRAQQLGEGVDYAGDPQQPAAFVSVAARQEPSTVRIGERAGSSTPAVSAVEHVTVGGAATPVVTAAQITKDLKIAGHPALSLGLAPDPTGKLLALDVADANSSHDFGVAIYTRQGRFVGYLAIGAAGPVSWSPSGNQLLINTANGIVAWTPGRPPQRIALPPSVAMLQGCAWSPDGTQLACTGYPRTPNNADLNYTPPPPEWVLVDVPHKTAKLCPAHGQPLLWES